MHRNRISYNPKLKEIAREFRNNPTKQEKILWNYLKGNQIEGYDFHRQKPLDNYIVDFYCTKLRLAIEIDGSIHNEEYNKIKDYIRQDRLEDYGISFIRFSNTEIENSIEEVLNTIKEFIIYLETRNKNNAVG